MIRHSTPAERRTFGAAVDFVVRPDRVGTGQFGEILMTRENLQDFGRQISEALLPGVRGKLLDRFWAELDDIVERLQAGAEAEDDVGKARNASYFIAIMKNAVAPDVEAVKDEAYRRWLEQHPDD